MPLAFASNVIVRERRRPVDWHGRDVLTRGSPKLEQARQEGDMNPPGQDKALEGGATDDVVDSAATAGQTEETPKVPKVKVLRRSAAAVGGGIELCWPEDLPRIRIPDDAGNGWHAPNTGGQ